MVSHVIGNQDDGPIGPLSKEDARVCYKRFPHDWVGPHYLHITRELHTLARVAKWRRTVLSANRNKIATFSPNLQAAAGSLLSYLVDYAFPITISSKIH